MELKKLFESFRRSLEETVTDIVYHITQLDFAEEILKTNTFLLSAPLGKRDSDMNQGKKFYFSTARSPQSYYFKDHESNTSVIFVLDGKKLSQNYKSMPVDHNSSIVPPTSRDADEMEDRIVSNKSMIKNASQYIMEIHCLVKDKPRPYKEKTISSLAEIYNISHKYKIPVYSYLDKRQFLLLNKNKSLTFEKVVDILQSRHGSFLTENRNS